MLPSLRFALLIAFAPAGAAQTFIVDQANGPGTHFTSIAAAIAAVPDGAVLRIRAGFYFERFDIVGKGLTLLGEGRVVVSMPTYLGPRMNIDGIGPSQSVWLRNLTVVANSNNPTNVAIACSNSPGLIVIEGTPSVVGAHLNVEARACARLVLRDCDLSNSFAYENLRVENSNCVLERCILDAGIGSGLVQTGGSVQMVDTSVKGGRVFLGPARPGIDTTAGDLRLLGTSAVHGGSSAVGGAAQAIAGTGTVRHDPGVVFTGATPPLDPRLTVQTLAMPRLLTTQSSLQLQAELYVPAGQFGVLAVALPGPVTPLPSFADALWLDPPSSTVLAFGVPAAGAALSHTLPLSGSPTSTGLPLCWQGVGLGAAAAAQLSNPSVQLIR